MVQATLPTSLKISNSVRLLASLNKHSPSSRMLNTSGPPPDLYTHMYACVCVYVCVRRDPMCV